MQIPNNLQFLALINRAGGLYIWENLDRGREYRHTHDQGQDSPIQNKLTRLIRCLLYGKQEKFNSFNVTG